MCAGTAFNVVCIPVTPLERLKELEVPENVIDRDFLATIKKLTNSTVIKVSCPCGSSKDLKVSSLVRTLRRSGNYLCMSCRITEKHQDPSYSSDHRKGIRDSWSEERRDEQSVRSKRMWADEAFRESVTSSSMAAWDDEERRRGASERGRALWEDEAYRNNHPSTDFSTSPSRSLTVRRMWEDDEYRVRQEEAKRSLDHRRIQSDMALERWEDGEYRKLVIESQKELWDPEYRKEMSDRIKKLWKDPEYLEKQRIANADLNLLKAKSDRARRQWRDPSFKERHAKAMASALVNGRDSILERTVQTLLTAFDVPYVRHHVIGPFEFDLFVPSHNLLVECQGEYWHSSQKARARDASKLTYIHDYFPDLRVLTLWERDFLNPDVVRQKLFRELSGDLTAQSPPDFRFSDVSLSLLDPTDRLPGSYYSAPQEFLQSFHYGGYGRSAKRVHGACLGGVLVAVCKFSTPVRKEVASSMGLPVRRVLELDRFCIHPGFHKKNFASWLLSRCSARVFSEFPDVSVLVSFADATFGHLGTIYRASNWKEVGLVRPDYHYVGRDGFVVHKKTLYNHASRINLREKEYAEANGYLKVFGREKKKFVLDRPSSV